MKARAHNKYGFRAMTLVELLLVFFVIVILVAMILPMLSSPPRHSPANRARARVDMSALATAVENYEADYSRLPLGDYATNEDITCGISSAEIQGFKKIDGTKLVATNSDLLVILMDIDSGANTGHKYNPKQIKYLNARVVPDVKSNGFSVIDHQYRDPWGNPYVVSLDADQDGFVRDAFYACPDLFANHTPTTLINTNGIYAHHGRVMIWSRGSDGKASMTVPAKSGVNKDNVFSWE